MQEAGTDAVRLACGQAEVAATARAAYAQAAALALAVRVGRLAAGDRDLALSAFRSDWSSFSVVDVSRAVAEVAARHGLRGYAAVRLAAALQYARRSDRAVTLGAWDAPLNDAAAANGLTLPHQRASGGRR